MGGLKTVLFLTLMVYVKKLSATNLNLSDGQLANVKLFLYALMMKNSTTISSGSSALNIKNVTQDNLGSLTTSAKPLVKKDLCKILLLEDVLVKILLCTTDLMLTIKDSMLEELVL